MKSARMLLQKIEDLLLVAGALAYPFNATDTYAIALEEFGDPGVFSKSPGTCGVWSSSSWTWQHGPRLRSR